MSLGVPENPTDVGVDGGIGDKNASEIIKSLWEAGGAMNGSPGIFMVFSVPKWGAIWNPRILKTLPKTCQFWVLSFVYFWPFAM